MCAQKHGCRVNIRYQSLEKLTLLKSHTGAIKGNDSSEKLMKYVTMTLEEQKVHMNSRNCFSASVRSDRASGL